MTDRPILNILNRLLILAALIVTAIGFALVPLDATLPIHWNINGVADNFAPAPIALLIPAVMALFVVGLMFALRPAGLRKDFEAGRHVIDAAISFILALTIVLTGATIAIGMGITVDIPRLIAFIFGAMLLVLGNYLPKTQPNWVAGIRLPWILRDPNNWAITHRWSGRLMMLGGAAALVAAILNPPSMVLLIVVLAAALLPALASVAISYALARR